MRTAMENGSSVKADVLLTAFLSLERRDGAKRRYRNRDALEH